MLKATLLASVLALGAAIPARAASDVKRSNEATRPTRTALPAEVVEVQAQRSTGSVIFSDAVGGALLGGAAGAGVAAYNRYVPSNGTWDGWEKDVAIGAGIGLGVGLIFGLIDASSTDHTTYVATPVADQRASGFAPPVALYGARF